jgi:endonuclease III related protein
LLPKKSVLLNQLYTLSFLHFGHRNWWPADTQFEVCVGAILTQNTAWTNVAKAISNLKSAGALDPRIIAQLPITVLAETIRPAGYYNVKAKRLRNFIDYLASAHDFNLSQWFESDVQHLRSELLTIKGIGKETADSIILYAAKKPIFVVDAYTRRVLFRHNFIAETDEYDEIQNLFHENLKPDLDLFSDFHAQFVAVGHHFCRPKPKCSECPLQRFNEV